MGVEHAVLHEEPRTDITESRDSSEQSPGSALMLLLGVAHGAPLPLRREPPESAFWDTSTGPLAASWYTSCGDSAQAKMGPGLLQALEVGANDML
mmetsp:Transcript_103277/g.287456  ORF Transcript_103277/g.287456 Transcript_103277/m.287456 type:complete len:95 (-) Transcript_103277:152-436(-)